MNQQIIIYLGIAAALAACSKGHQDSTSGSNDAREVVEANGPSIDFVKSQSSASRGLTFGQVLDNSPNCASRRWVSIKDKYGRDVVRFRCDIKLPEERLGKMRQETVVIVQRQANSGGNPCPAVIEAFTDMAVQNVNKFYDRFASAVEVMEFVINQNEIVETRVGLSGQDGELLALNSYGIDLVSSDLQATGDGQRGLDHLFQIIGDSSPRPLMNCYQMEHALAAAGRPPAINGGASVNAGDAEPEPKHD